MYSPALAQDRNTSQNGVAAPPPNAIQQLDSEGGLGNTSMPVSATESRTLPATNTTDHSTTFLLIVMIALFGLYLYSNNSTNSRLNRLEASLRGGAGYRRERAELVPFSWDAVLHSLNGGFSLLPGLVLPSPCLFLLGIENKENIAEYRQQLVANLVNTVLQDPEFMTIAVLRHMGSTELGHQLLSQIGGSNWDEMDDSQRQEMLRHCGKDLEHIEKSLYCLSDLVLTPDQLYQTCQEVLETGDLGAVIIDDLAAIVPDEYLSTANDGEANRHFDTAEFLRLLSSRCHTPLCLVTEIDSPTWTYLCDRDAIGALARLRWSEGEVTAKFSTDSNTWVTKTWQVNSSTGTMISNSEGD